MAYHNGCYNLVNYQIGNMKNARNIIFSFLIISIIFNPTKALAAISVIIENGGDEGRFTTTTGGVALYNADTGVRIATTPTSNPDFFYLSGADPITNYTDYPVHIIAIDAYGDEGYCVGLSISECQLVGGGTEEVYITSEPLWSLTEEGEDPPPDPEPDPEFGFDPSFEEDAPPGSDEFQTAWYFFGLMPRLAFSVFLPVALFGLMFRKFRNL